MPSEDTGAIIINTESAQGTSFEDMVRMQKQLAAIVAEDPNVFASGPASAGRQAPGRKHREIFIA